jgi:hypothetical protein
VAQFEALTWHSLIAEVHKPCTRARDGPARHVAGEGMAASAIGGDGERTLSERDR